MSEKQYSPARLWEAQDDDIVRCRLCAHYCSIDNDSVGKCGVRKNIGGSLFTRSANEVAAINLDPVEKKPLYHFLPGTFTFSFGTFGCNFACDFCQNNDISQYCRLWEEAGQKASPERLVQLAQKYKAASISYTYNEPTVFFELMQPTARMAHDTGLRNVMVSNAYMSPEAFKELDGLIDAANFDLKSFNDDFYKDFCGARLKPVLQTIKRAVRSGWWVELTTLVISGLNDSENELSEMAMFIAGELGADIPWHVSRFHPAYKMQDRPATNIASLERALEAGYKAGLKYVYAGNVPGHKAENTFCPVCKASLLERQGYTVAPGFSGLCPECGEVIVGFWK